MANTGLIVGGIDEERVLVEDLAREYISKNECIALVTITCESKFATVHFFASSL